MGVKDVVKQVLTKQQNKRYEKQLALRKISYDSWVREAESARTVRNTAVGACQEDATSEKAVLSTCGAYVLLVQKEGRLSDRALAEISAYFEAHPEVELLYGDEDMLLSDGSRANPWYKPCWSPDLYCSYFYLGSVIAVRKTLFERIGEKIKDTYIEFENGEEIEQLVYRLVTAAGGFQKKCRSIGHLEYVLFHVESEDIWKSYQKMPSGRRIACSEQTAFREEKVSPEAQNTTVSVIIPSKDNPEVLRTCLQSLHLEKRPAMEGILVDNGSSSENKAKIEGIIKEIADQTGTEAGKICYLYEPMEFNFSRMCNRGAEQAKGNFLLFLNDDMEMCDDDWLEVMEDRAAREYVGAVGLKLYYPDSVRIQHAGIVNLPVGPVHKLQYMEDDRDYYFGRNHFSWNCVAVTGACLLIDREKFYEAGGFKEALRVAYNDVELGFALQELGYQNVVMNDRYAWHHESLSRGNDETKEKLKRLEQERELLYKMHPTFRGEDPYYPAGLNRQGLDSRVVPGYVTVRNTIQANCWEAFPYREEDLRHDQCLMVRVESSGPELIQGYSVVLGDNNACYEKYLVLMPEISEKTETEQVAEVKPLYMKLEGQYRQDLEENIPDQVNVALDGFCVSRKEEPLPIGNYRIAVLAVNRVTGLKLINESGKYLTVEE